MDPTTAALLGAFIGAGGTLLGGTIGPWVRDAASRRAAQRAETRSLQRVELLAAIEAFGTLLRTRQLGARDQHFATQHASAAVAISRLCVNTEQRDRDLERMLGYSLDVISNGHLQAGPVAMTALTDVLHRWYRRELRGAAIGDEFERQLKDGLNAQVAKKDDPSI